MRSGLSKNAVKNAIADTSIQRVNRYFEGGVIPLPHVLARVARVIDVPWPLAFWRAGYFRELLGAVNSVTRAAQKPSGSTAKVLKDQRYHAELAVLFAVTAFPRRDATVREPFTVDAIARLEPFFAQLADDVPGAQKKVAALTASLPKLLDSAAAVLGDSGLSATYRRAIAGEYVNAWADEYDCELADRLRAEQRSTDHLVATIMAAVSLAPETGSQ